MNWLVIEVEQIHCVRTMKICRPQNKLGTVMIGWGNDLTPVRSQAITWSNAALLSIGPLGTNFSEILVEILIFSLKEMRFEMSSAKQRLFCSGRDELNNLRIKVITCLPTWHIMERQPAVGVTTFVVQHEDNWHSSSSRLFNFRRI